MRGEARIVLVKSEDGDKMLRHGYYMVAIEDMIATIRPDTNRAEVEREQRMAWMVPLWDAINRLIAVCGGNAELVSESHMDLAAEIERTIEQAILQQKTRR